MASQSLQAWEILPQGTSALIYSTLYFSKASCSITISSLLTYIFVSANLRLCLFIEDLLACTEKVRYLERTFIDIESVQAFVLFCVSPSIHLGDEVE